MFVSLPYYQRIFFWFCVVGQTLSLGKGVAADPPRRSSTTKPNLPIYDTPLYIDVTCEPIMQFLKGLRFEMSEDQVEFFERKSDQKHTPVRSIDGSKKNLDDFFSFLTINY